MSKLTTPFITDAAITTPKVADGAITAQKLAAGLVTTRITETFTLSGTDITNKYVTLTHTPAVPGNMTLLVAGEGSQLYGIDFQYVAQTGPVPSASWSTLALDGVLLAGDKIQVAYSY